jgi:hypothetical protein
MRNSFTSPDDAVVVSKAGMNDDPHHGHLDCGHFLIYWRNQQFIADIGSPKYDELYFNEARWDYPHASSAGHNVVFVNGELQIPAKLKDQPWREGIGGKVVEFRQGKDRDYTLLDPTHAYPGKELKGWRRHIIFEKPNITVVVDEIRSSPGAEIEVRFHSEVTQIPKERYLLLDGKDGDMALIPVADGDFTLRQAKHAGLPVMTNVSFEWIPYCGIVVRAKTDCTVIASIILPVDGESETEEIVNSVEKKIDNKEEFKISFNKLNKECVYNFKKDKNFIFLK